MALYPACLDPAHPRPLKLGIHKDLFARHRPGAEPAPAAPLPPPPAGSGAAVRWRLRRHIRRLLAWHCAQPRYLQQLVAGATRIDVEGKPAGEVTAAEAAYAAAVLSGARPPRPSPPPDDTPPPPRSRRRRPAVTPPESTLPADAPLGEENIVPGHLELTIKFNQLPKAQPVQAGMKIGIRTHEALVVMTVPLKAWKKLTQAAAQWPAWVAAVTGTLGTPVVTATGTQIVLERPALQVFEKKPKPTPAPTAAAAEPTPERR